MVAAATRGEQSRGAAVAAAAAVAALQQHRTGAGRAAAAQAPQCAGPAASGARRASSALLAERALPSKWGEVVTSLPVMRLSAQSAASEPIATPAPPSPPSGTAWRRRGDFRSQEAARDRGPREPSPSRLEVPGRSALPPPQRAERHTPAAARQTAPQAGSGVRVALSSLERSDVVRFEGSTPRGQPTAASDTRATWTPAPPHAALRDRWALPPEPSPDGVDDRWAALEEAAREAPLPPCLKEMLGFLLRRVEEQGAQVAELRSELAARARFARAFSRREVGQVRANIAAA